MEIFIPTFLKFCYTIAVVFILARFLYYPGRGQREYLFTLILLSAIIAELCILISRTDMSFGFALGIFAIFSLIRYRTAPIAPREMTYIFLSVGIAAKNHLAPDDMEFYKFLVTDGMILLLAAIGEHFLFREKYVTKSLVYDKLELIHPERREDLLLDLEQRFGITGVKKVKTGEINAPRGSVRMLVEFTDPSDSNL